MKTYAICLADNGSLSIYEMVKIKGVGATGTGLTENILIKDNIEKPPKFNRLSKGEDKTIIINNTDEVAQNNFVVSIEENCSGFKGGKRKYKTRKGKTIKGGTKKGKVIKGKTRKNRRKFGRR